MQKSSFLTILFSFIPGAGQMYQGYIKRGTSLMTLFFLFCFGGNFLGNLIGYLFEGVWFLLPIIWFYSFFDSLNLRTRIIHDMEIEPDAWMFQCGLPKRRFSFQHKWLGAALVVVGALALYTNFVPPLLNYNAVHSNPFLAQFLYKLPSLVIFVAMIIIGIKMIIGGKNKDMDISAGPVDSAGTAADFGGSRDYGFVGGRDTAADDFASHVHCAAPDKVEPSYSRNAQSASSGAASHFAEGQAVSDPYAALSNDAVDTASHPEAGKEEA